MQEQQQPAEPNSDLIPDLSSLSGADKQKFVEGFIKTTAEAFLKVYVMLGMKVGIESGVINEATGDFFIISFKKQPAEDLSAPAPIVGSDKITKDFWIKVRYEGDPVPDKAGNVERNIAAGVISAFSEWPNNKIEVDTMDWIDANATKPADGQACLFIAHVPGFRADGLILGGMYAYEPPFERPFHAPGHGRLSARWWMPIPKIPKPNK
jgi:hypothetical protein